MSRWLKNQEERPRPKVVEVEVPPFMQLGEYQDVIVFKDRYYGRRYSNVPYVIGTLADGAAGYGWGYGGCGPLDFAANILMHFTNHDYAVTKAYRNAFVAEFLLNMPEPGGRIPKEFIFDFIEKMKAMQPELLEKAKADLGPVRKGAW